MSEIAPGIHRIEEDLGPRFMAQYVLVGDERTVLVDTGLSQTLEEAIAPYLASIGLAVDALDDLLVSHADVDHVGSNRRLRELSPRTRVWCGERDRRWIESNACMLAENYRWAEPYGLGLPEEALGWIEHKSSAGMRPSTWACAEVRRCGSARGSAGRCWHCPGTQPATSASGMPASASRS